MTTTAASIVIDEFIPRPIESVWKALTDRAAIAQWLMENDFEPVLGHRFTFKAPPIPAVDFDGIVRCEVTAIEPPRLLAYSWAGGTMDTVVTYRLAPAQEGGKAGTSLHFEHSGFDLSNAVDQFAYNNMSHGWRSGVIPGLINLLDQQTASRKTEGDHG
ncbi:MAG: SRPBCC family protein [Dehalococcoidia bacterium]